MKKQECKSKGICSVQKKCGGCKYQGIPYEEQLKLKQKSMEKLLGGFCHVEPIIGMNNPCNYRNKVHHVFSRDKKGNVLQGIYESGTHRVVNVKECMLEDTISQSVIYAVSSLITSFKIKIYDEDTQTGFLRHVLVRRGFSSGELMVVLVCADSIFPSKNNFVKALRKICPDITTIVQNVNDKRTSMVLGKKNIALYGPGFIIDELCGLRFKISPDSFYQVNPVQTKVLYETAIEFASLTGKETVIDAYCGVGTIGLCAASKSGKVIGAELNSNAVRDAIGNAKANRIENATFVNSDAGKFMVSMAMKGEKADVVFMDPPRSGSTEEFMNALASLSPSRIVYVSCGPDTLARDLAYLKRKGYIARKIQPVDMFPFTEHVETVALLSRETCRPDMDYIKVGIDAEEYYAIKNASRD